MRSTPKASCRCRLTVVAACVKGSISEYWQHRLFRIAGCLVKDALLQDDRETVSVYAFAPTKIANIAFERWFDLNIPLSFSFIMKTPSRRLVPPTPWQPRRSHRRRPTWPPPP